ncbi:Tubulin polyglutamylase TTLL4 [Merluccius polli]|uniref:Tubulin polyglutamylase TTLL4 n=1 Tax=Merluccius polli TaxID=89951 RepID=A0AA47NBM3_MERPO|nr:Tubulin polyglutamylase TTLL4 [Merluccius polli]
MPTNQSSPWGSGRLRTPSKPDSPTTTTTITTAAEVPPPTHHIPREPPLVHSGSKDWASGDGNNNHALQSQPQRWPQRQRETPHIELSGVVTTQDSDEKDRSSGHLTGPACSTVPVPEDRIRRSSRVSGLEREQRALSPEEDMETSSAFSPDNQPQPTATKTIRPTKQTTAHNGYAPADGHHIPSAAQCSTANTHSMSSLATRTSCQPIAKPSLKTGSSLSTPQTTEKTNGHFLPKPRPSASSADCSLKPTWGTVMPSESCADTTASEDKTQEPASCPAGASVGAVANQISAIHLTKLSRLSSSSSSSPHPSPGVGDSNGGAQLSGKECVAMQVDGEEEEFPDEFDDGCSVDESSDCSSIICVPYAAAALDPLYSVEDPVCVEERSALVPSLFPFFPPTLYFSTANERVEMLPQEQRKLLKWKMSSVTPNVVRHIIARSHFKTTKRSHDWLGCWGHHMKSPLFKTIEEHQKLNHFPGSFQIGRKDRLWRNLSKMRARFGKQEFSFFPRTFILPQDIRLLRRAWEDAGARQKWIIKPPASARGTGIQVIYKWCQMPKKRPLLVQKYLHKPYLISGNKFDLRIYVYVTSYDPLRIYIFSDGLVRFASCKYSSSMRSLGNKFMHLTNYSVNKKNSEYQTNSDNKACQGHKWALKALWQYLGAKGINTTVIWDKIKDMVIKTIIASDPYINSLLKMHVRSPYSCHELFGFDIMLDDKLKPWVLEVNISPSLHSNTALDVTIKGQMIRDVLNLAGFLLPPREQVAACSHSATSSTNRGRSRTELSTDEKVKRAFYISQTQQELYSSVLDVLTPEDVSVLAQSEDELGRRGDFERIFPSSSSSHYLRFFECRRYLNILLSQWVQKYGSDRNTGISLLRSLCQKGVHLGTSDPTHMWSKCSYVSRSEPKRADLSSLSVAISWQRRIHSEDEDDGGDEDVLDREVRSINDSPSPGSTPTTTPTPSPAP